ncbi:MAG: hypothetical protein IAE82_08560 [Opitutaceae bacterium]|nr:hypothetical protein [Opitutaceae bacterium]
MSAHESTQTNRRDPAPTTARTDPLDRALDALPPRLDDTGDVTAAVRRLLANLREATSGSERLYATAGEGFFSEGGLFSLPRLLYFGARGAPGAVRLAFFTGWSGVELRGSHALLAFVHHLMRHPELAEGYNLLFYPLVNVTGFLDGTVRTRLGHELERASWVAGVAPPELRSIAADFPRHAAHGWFTLSVSEAVTRLLVKTRRLPVHPDYLPVDMSGVPVDWRPVKAEEDRANSEKELAALASGSFGLSIEIPSIWRPSQYVPTVVAVLSEVLRRYRQAASYGGEL